MYCGFFWAPILLTESIGCEIPQMGKKIKLLSVFPKDTWVFSICLKGSTDHLNSHTKMSSYILKLYIVSDPWQISSQHFKPMKISSTFNLSVENLSGTHLSQVIKVHVKSNMDQEHLSVSFTPDTTRCDVKSIFIVTSLQMHNPNQTRGNVT